MGAGQGQAFNFKKEYLQLIKVQQRSYFEKRKELLIINSFIH